MGLFLILLLLSCYNYYNYNSLHNKYNAHLHKIIKYYSKVTQNASIDTDVMYRNRDTQYLIEPVFI